MRGGRVRGDFGKTDTIIVDMSSSPIRRYIQEQFKVSLPLGGGDGSSATQAIILTNKYSDPDLLIQSVLNYYHEARELSWDYGNHTQFIRYGHMYEKYEVLYPNGKKQTFYFDSTIQKQSTFIYTTNDYLKNARYIIRQHKKASPALLQRTLKIGYARAAQLLDVLEEQGYIGPPDGAKPRKLLKKLR